MLLSMHHSNGELSSVRCVLYTDDELLAIGASSVLASVPHLRVLTAEPALASLVPFVEETRPEVILLDVTPEVTVGLIATLRRIAPAARLILWGRAFSEELRYQASNLGVTGFLQRTGTAEGFADNLLDLVNGNQPAPEQKPDHSRTVSLTKRESQLVTLLAQGLRNKEIAACIGITEGTVRIYLSKLFAKIGARDRFEVAVSGLKNSYCGQASWDGRDGFVTDEDADRARPVLRSLVLVEPQRRRGYARRKATAAE